jgi:hypothetical protein
MKNKRIKAARERAEQRLAETRALDTEGVDGADAELAALAQDSADELSLHTSAIDYLKDRAADTAAGLGGDIEAEVAAQAAGEAPDLSAFDEPEVRQGAAEATAAQHHRRGLWAGGATLTIVAGAAWLFLGWTFQSNPAEARRADAPKFPVPAPRLSRHDPVTLSDPEMPASSLRMQPLFSEPRDAGKN